MKHQSHFNRHGKAAFARAWPASRALALAVAIALAIPGAAVLAGEPIPGVDVELGKNPGGISQVLPVDAAGRFNLRITERGGYTLSTSCRLPAGCLPHTLSVNPTGTEPGPAQGILNIISGATPGADMRAIDIRIVALGAGEKAGRTRFDFNVDARPVVIGGEFHGGAPGLAVMPGPGDFNGDGRAELGTGRAPKPTSSGGGQSFPIGNLGTLSAPRPQGGDVNPGVAEKEANSALQQVSTTRGTAPRSQGSDVKPGIVETGDALMGVSTTRGTAPRPQGGEVKPGIADGPRAMGEVSTTRGTAPRPQGGDVKPGIAEKEANDVLLQVSTTRGTAPRPQGGDVKPGIAEAGDALMQVSTTRGTAPRPQGGEVTPGVAEGNTAMGDVSTTRGIVPNPTPINDAPSIFDRWGVRGGGLPTADSPQAPGRTVAGVQIGIVAESGGAKVSALTDARGAFQFSRLPAGKYNLSIPGEPAQSVMVGPGGALNGDLKLSSAGTLYVTSFSFGAAAPASGSGTAKRSADFGSTGNLGFGVGSGPLGGVMPGIVTIPGGAMSPGGAMGGAR